jgi:hypothetical protein
MNIFLTLDYELYFGDRHGTVEGCMLQPTRELIKIGDATGARMTFFVDVGFLIKLDEFSSEFPQLKQEYALVAIQLRELVAKGHDVQLHIHPHWEDCVYDGTKWNIDVTRYKLDDFSEEEIRRIVRSYKEKLEEISGQKIQSYRAGGWCLQPFSKVKQAFEENGLVLDSTVFPKGHFESEHYFYDFRNAPEKSRYRFDDDLCVANENGQFWEFPIGHDTIKPLFFWRLFFWGRLDPKNHKPIGDGVPIPTPGWRKKVLSQTTNHCVSLDGYFATRLGKAVRKRKKETDLVIIGHPKACTWFSLKTLSKFVAKHAPAHNFITFSKVLKDL